MWQVIKDRKVVKEYPTHEQCIIWCYEKGYIIQGFPDFRGDKPFKSYVEGIEIKESNETR